MSIENCLRSRLVKSIYNKSVIYIANEHHVREGKHQIHIMTVNFGNCGWDDENLYMAVDKDKTD